jgi:transcriptional regulator with XRE-family HTH domain
MSSLNTALLSQMIKDKRGNIGLRDAAKEIGQISATTLSRLENEHLPDIETYAKVCAWLNVPTNFFHETTDNVDNISSKKTIIAHLRADKLLPKKNAAALINMIELAYAELEKLPAH